MGNHEIAFEEKHGQNLHDSIHKAGGIVLDFDHRDISVRGKNLRIGGCYVYGLPGNLDIMP